MMKYSEITIIFLRINIMSNNFNPEIDYSKVNMEQTSMEDTDEIVEKLMALRDQWLQLGDILDAGRSREEKSIKNLSYEKANIRESLPRRRLVLPNDVVKHIVEEHMSECDSDELIDPAHPAGTIYDDLFE